MRASRLIVIGLTLLLSTVAVQAVETPPALTHVSVHAAVDLDAADFEARLRSLGMRVEVSAPELGRWQGWIAEERLEALRQSAGVLALTRPRYAVFAAGTANSEGDAALGAAAARAAFGVDGSGVRVAVISNGVDGLDQAQRAGDSPPEVKAYAFGSGSLAGGDEGTAMIEIVHDLAPGAELSFGAVATDLDHIAAVNWFAARVDVIVDDVSFFYPANQASEVSLNTTRALHRPDWPLRVYVTAAGNWAERHWSGQFEPGLDGVSLDLPERGPVHRFGGGLLQGHGNTFSLDANERVTVALHWDDEWGRSTNDYELYLLDADGRVAASSTNRQGVDTFLPQELVQFQNGDAPGRYTIVIQSWRGTAELRRLDLFAIDHTAHDGSPLRLSLRTAAGSLLAQSDAVGAITVGAAAHGESDIAPYSSRGPTWNGAQKPELAALDGVSVSAATTFRPRFSGSSAAAPHVAAAAALMLEAQPALLARNGGSAQLERRLAREFLLTTARDIGDLGIDMSSGHGLLNALLAVRAADRRVIVVQSAADRGPGSLRDAITRVNAGEADTILFTADSAERVIELESALPAVTASGAVIDGSGWTLHAAASERGIELAGDRIELWGLEVVGAGVVGVWAAGSEVKLIGVSVQANGERAAENSAGIWLDGAAEALLQDVEAIRNWGHGIMIANRSSAVVEHSWIGVERGADIHDAIAPNLGYGVRIRDDAGDVRIGPPLRPAPVFEANQVDPLGVLALAAERSGVAHTVRGWVTVDGLPAPAGTLLSAYLDRVPAAVVVVNESGRFTATIWGPGRQIRFAVGGAPVEGQVEFSAGAETEVLLRAASVGRRTPADISGGNVIAGNALGGVRFGSGGSAVRDIWGNLMWGQERSIASSTAAPSLSWAAWQGDAASVGGRAEGASRVDIYAGPADGARRYIGSAEVEDRRFTLERVVVEAAGETVEFSAVAVDQAQRVSAESAVLRGPGAPLITSIKPAAGGTLGGDLVAICGQRLAEPAAAAVGARIEPEVWFGGSRAQIESWSDSCVEARAPAWPLKPSEAEAVDVALRRPDGRTAVVEGGYRYAPARLAALSPGWNLTAWSGPETEVADALGALAERVRRIYAWDGQGREWRIWSRELASELITLRRLSPQMSLWILLDGETGADWVQPGG